MSRTIHNSSSSTTDLYLFLTTNLPSANQFPNNSGTLYKVPIGSQYTFQNGYAILVTAIKCDSVKTGTSIDKTERNQSTDSPITGNYEVYNVDTGDYDDNITTIYWYNTSFVYNGSPSNTYIYLTAETTSETTLDINYSLSNASGTPTTITSGVPTTITITANNGYLLDTITASYTTDSETTTINFTISENKKTATTTITSDNTWTAISISNTSTTEQTEQKIQIDNELITASSVSYTPTAPSQGDEIIFTFTSDNGYEFITAPSISCYNSNTGNYDSYTATVNDDKSSATLTITSEQTTNITSILITSVATIKSDVPTTSYDFINIMTITNDNLKSLAKVRFHANGSSINVIDLGRYVTSLKKFYCDIPTSISSSIILGLYDTNIEGMIVSQDTIKLDCGSVTIESTNNNSNDYNNDIKIILPFIGTESLDADLIMNRTINLKYNISLITGICVAILYSDNIPIYSYSGKIYENIPYILNDVDFNLLGDIDMNTNILYGFVPTIIITYKENYNNDDTILLNDNKYTKLSDLSGLNYISDVIIDSNIADDEKNLIKATLSEGVIF